MQVDGRGVGSFSDEQLAAGVKLCSATADGWIPGGPWEAQAWSLTALTESRWQLFQSRRMATTYMTTHPELAEFGKHNAEINGQLESLQRDFARPVKYHFALKVVTK